MRGLTSGRVEVDDFETFLDQLYGWHERLTLDPVQVELIWVPTMVVSLLLSALCQDGLL